jgi:hypothetical protein
MTEYNIINGNIFHAEYTTMKEMGLTFFRMAEFYESPYDTIFRKTFSIEDFLDAYTEDDGYFPFIADWPAFNIPGKYVNEFYENFDLTKREKSLLRSIYQNIGDKPFYLISNLKHDTESFDHELCHALYYTNEEYKRQVLELLAPMNTAQREWLETKLLSMGYPENPWIMEDELNAYLATSSRETWESEEYFDTDYERVEELVKPFVQAFQDIKKTIQVSKILA